MAKRFWRALLLVGASPLACGSGSKDLAAPAAAGGSGSIGRPTFGAAGESAAGESALGVGGELAQGDGGAAGSDSSVVGQLGGHGPVNGGGSAPVTPAACDSKISWGNPTLLSGIDTPDADERLLSMTSDELSLVFARDQVLYVADRAHAEDLFGAPVALTLPDGYTFEHGLALSADGRSLVIVSSGDAGFAEVTRAARAGAFGTEPSTTRFASLNDNAHFVGGTLSSPVLSRSGDSLYYTQLAGSSSLVFHAQGKPVFALPQMAEDMISLGSSDAKPKLTLSVAADERVLFAFDVALGHAVGLWNAAAGGPFTHLVLFPGLESVFTNDGCSRLYGSRKLDASLDIVIETPK